jgi:hypothetical protein
MTVYKYGFESNNSTITLEDKRDYIRVIRVSDWGEGSLLGARFLYHDSTTGMDYFQATSPEGFSKFGIVSVWQEGNVFQIIQLAAAEVIRPAGGSSGGGGGGGGGGSGSSRASENAAAQATPSVPTLTPTPAETVATISESPAITGPAPSISPGVTVQPDEVVVQGTHEDQGASVLGSLTEGTTTLVILKNLSVVFVVIFITTVFYLRWKKREG